MATMYNSGIVSEFPKKLDKKYPLFKRNGSEVDKNFALI
jgi:hypothetical protein